MRSTKFVTFTSVENQLSKDLVETINLPHNWAIENSYNQIEEIFVILDIIPSEKTLFFSDIDFRRFGQIYSLKFKIGNKGVHLLLT